MISFDRGATFTPGMYELHKPPKWKQLGKAAKKGGNTAKTGNSPIQVHHATEGVRTVLGARNPL